MCWGGTFGLRDKLSLSIAMTPMRNDSDAHCLLVNENYRANAARRSTRFSVAIKSWAWVLWTVSYVRNLVGALCALLILMPVSQAVEAKTIAQIIDSTGDGAGNPLSDPHGIAVDGSGNVYVAASFSNNVFQIDPNGVITEIIDSTGDGAGNMLAAPTTLAVDTLGNVYVTGQLSDNAFRVDPNGVTTEIIDEAGDKAGNSLGMTFGIAVDNAGAIYVTGQSSDNAFRIDPNGVISEIIDSTGGVVGGAVILDQPNHIAVDTAGNVYVTGSNSFRIDPNGVITELGIGGFGIAVDGEENAYVSSGSSVFRIAPNGVITVVIDSTGDGAGNTLSMAGFIVADGVGNVYVAGVGSDNVFRIDPNGVITEVIDSTGDGAGNKLDNPIYVAVDGLGNVYVTGKESNNAFRIQFCGDGIIDPGEECDDGNNVDEDRCSRFCQGGCLAEDINDDGLLDVTDSVVLRRRLAGLPPCAHDKCETGIALSPCDPCVAEICQADSFCCDTAWDGRCVGEVLSVCAIACP